MTAAPKVDWCNLPAGHNGDHNPTCGDLTDTTRMCGPMYFGSAAEDRICTCTWSYWDPTCPDYRHNWLGRDPRTAEIAAQLAETP